MSIRHLPLRRLAAALLVLGSTTLQAHAQQAPAAPAATPSTAIPSTGTTVFDGGIRRELARGVYEAIYSKSAEALYVASAEAITNVKGGVIYKLDPTTLETIGATHTDKKNFALALNPAGDTLYATNSIESGITSFDTKTGEVKARLKFDDKASDGTPYGPRQIIYQADADVLYVGGVGAPGLIWVVDAKTLKLITTIPNAGKWVTGLLLDPASKRLYAANGDGEVLVIDSEQHKILSRWTPGDDKPYLLLNLALDAKTNRLFVTDHSQAKTVLIFDTQSGKVVKRLPVGDSLGIKLNPVRNEIYVTHRDQGTLSVLDADSYAVLRTFTLPPNPNSLALDPTGQILYVTIKTPFNKDYSSSAPESVARIALDQIAK